jgi:hypothetical protein
MSMFWMSVLLGATSACPITLGEAPPDLAFFAVRVDGVYVAKNDVRTPLAVVTRCADQYPSQADVPKALRGTKACRYQIPRGEVEIDLVAAAQNGRGEVATDFEGSVTFRTLPGDMAGPLKSRWATASHGQITKTIRVLHPYGEVRVWVEDAPAPGVFVGGKLSGAPDDYPAESDVRTFASGVSAEMFFEDQSLQSLQIPATFDNRSSQFIGNFVSVGKNPESGEVLVQSCEADPVRDKRPALMVVTGVDPSGFFVSDVSACRLPEWKLDESGASQVRTMEPPEDCTLELSDGGRLLLENADGGVPVAADAGAGVCLISRRRCAQRSQCTPYLPGTFASMFVFNYNFPDGLDEGDLLFTLSGSVQEFTSTTQLVFPAWSVAERVRLLPEDQWNKWLQFAKPVEIGGRLCGMDNMDVPFLTDQTCGHNRRNLKLESLESALVTIRNVRFPTQFQQCDLNNDGTVPFFCETRDPDGTWVWSSCGSGETGEDGEERECHQNCVLGKGKHFGQICSETSAFESFGQFVVELSPPGADFTSLDDSLSERFKVYHLPAPAGEGAGASVSSEEFSSATELAAACTGPVHYRTGTSSVAADARDPLLPENTPLRLTLDSGETTLALAAAQGAVRCSVARNIHARINLVTKDAVPEINPNCRVDDPNEERAVQCRRLRDATFEIVGHLKQTQPARPRWTIIPRAATDICCHPKAGEECPRPIKACP